MLTQLAEENIQFAPHIVRLIEAHLQKVPFAINLKSFKKMGSVFLLSFDRPKLSQHGSKNIRCNQPP